MERVARVRLEHRAGPELSSIRQESDEALRSARLVARVVLNQGNGTFEQTNMIADDVALMIVQTLRREGLLKEEEA